jgi:NitT/TauT family transport system permease protein
MQNNQPHRRTVWLLRGALLAAALIAWQVGVDRGVLTQLFFGSPRVIGATIINWLVSSAFYVHLYVTLVETLLSFVIGTAFALVLGLWLALSPLWAAVFDPFIKAANSMPRLILAPIFAIWFGLGLWSKVALGVTLVFFGVFFNVYQGIREVSPVLLANTRMLGASRQQLIRRVYLPSAMTWVFSSLHLSVGMAFIGAVIGEYLGSSEGVGYLILQAEGTFDTDAVLAGIVLLTIFALVLDAVISTIERTLLVWRPSTQ